MSRILVSGLINTETTVRVRQFPINYYPIDYPFFGVQSAVSGVGYNIALALTALGDQVRLCSMIGSDYPAEFIRHELGNAGIDTQNLKRKLPETPASAVLYDETGKRQIYCDLKDIQETSYDFSESVLDDVDIVVACNINFNRELLDLAKAKGKLIATDVHVLSNIWDDYNRDFLNAADILFLSDEGIGDDYQGFLWALAGHYPADIIVLGRGGKGAAMYLRSENRIVEMCSVRVGPVVNTVGAGDALFSSFLHYYAKGFSPADALHRAQIFASAKIGTSGASKGFVNEQTVEQLCLHFR